MIKIYAFVFVMMSVKIIFLGGGGGCFTFHISLYDKHYTTSIALLLALF